MATLSGREAVARAIAQEMRRDERVFLLGEDVEPGGVFKATVGLAEEFGRARVRNTPISEQAILGAAVGAAMTGMRPIAEITSLREDACSVRSLVFAQKKPWAVAP